MLALVGPNGAGKWSLLRCLYRYHRPTAGTVRLDGADLWQLEPRATARRIATVLQEPASDFGLSVAEIVELGLLALVGAALQSVTRTPLTDPHLLGISSGAALGAIIVLLHTGMFLGLATVPIFAFGGALLSAAIVVGVANLTRSTDASRLILAGVAVSFIITSGGSLAIFLGDPPPPTP